MRIRIDPQKLAIFGLSTGDVIDAIQSQNVQAAAGLIGAVPLTLSTDQRLQLTITTKGRLISTSEFGYITPAAAKKSLVVLSCTNSYQQYMHQNRLPSSIEVSNNNARGHPFDRAVSVALSYGTQIP